MFAVALMFATRTLWRRPARASVAYMSYSLSYILRTLWLTHPDSSNRPQAAESIVEAVETLENDLLAARRDIETLRQMHENWLLKSRMTTRKPRG